MASHFPLLIEVAWPSVVQKSLLVAGTELGWGIEVLAAGKITNSVGDPYLVAKYTNTKISSPAVSWEPGDLFPLPLRDIPGRSQWQGVLQP